MLQIMTTKEVSKYVKLHEFTILKYAAQGKIPATRIGKVWRFDKAAIDEWIGGNQNNPGNDERSSKRATPKKDWKKAGVMQEP